MSILRLSTFSLTIVLFTMGALILPVNIVLADDCKGNHKKLAGCDGPGGGGSGEGGKAFLFAIDDEDAEATDFLICGGATDTGASSGQFGVSGNVLWDPEFIHVHFKLQLKDVEPGIYPIFGNNGIACPGGQATDPRDFPACEGGDCTVGHVSITVKKDQGRTSGVLRLPGCDDAGKTTAGKTTTVWVTVPIDFPKVLRSTPVTIVLPPNEVGTGCPPPNEVGCG